MNLNINRAVNDLLSRMMYSDSDRMMACIKNDNNNSGRDVYISVKNGTFGPDTFHIKIELNSDNKKTDEEVTISNMVIKSNVVIDFFKEDKFIMTTYPTYYKCILNPLVKRVNAISCIEKKPGE